MGRVYHGLGHLKFKSFEEIARFLMGRVWRRLDVYKLEGEKGSFQREIFTEREDQI